MTKKRLKALDWSIKAEIEDFNPALTRFEHYLKDYRLRESTICDYKARVGRFLKYAQTDQPSIDIAKEFREQLILRNSARSSVNNYSFALKKYLEMTGSTFEFPYLNKNNNLPYYFKKVMS